MLKNINNKKGFTLVELLIVIVVIAILAAISIVAYSGIQNRAKTSAGQSLASQVSRKAEIFNTIRSTYPTTVATFNIIGGPAETRLDNSENVVLYRTVADNPGVHTVEANYHGGNKVIYRGGTNGGCVYWWDYTASEPKSTRFGTAPTGC